LLRDTVQFRKRTLHLQEIDKRNDKTVGTVEISGSEKYQVKLYEWTMKHGRSKRKYICQLDFKPAEND
jgi:hypothetical protein